MTIQTHIKCLQDIMRMDSGVDGDAQRISQLVWMIFLKIYDSKESDWEAIDDNYQSIIPEELRWRNWAADDEGITGEELLDFVDNKLFPGLSNLPIDENTDPRCVIVKSVFEDTYNYMKSGTLLRQVINKLNEIDFESYEDRHAFNDVYENILRDLQSAGNAGEFYTPRPVTQFVINMLNPKINEKVADFACGTGGFLVCALKHNTPKTVDERERIQKNIFGIEKKGLPYLLCVTNMILNDIDVPQINHDNSLMHSIKGYQEEDKFDVIAMNPPFGGMEEDIILANFPKKFQTKETADLFMVLIMYRLKRGGRAGVVLPDGFLFGEGVKTEIKKKLLSEFDLHTIVRLPNGVFAPYTGISTNLLFFDNTKPTEKIDFYQVPLPEGLKNGFTKTRPFKMEHLEGAKKWWDNRDNGDLNAYTVTIEEIKKVGYNLDFKNPNINNEEKEYSLNELLDNMSKKAENINILIRKLEDALEGVEE